LTAIANAKNASYYVTSPAKYYIRIIDTLAKDTCYSSQTVTMNAKPTAAFTFTPNAGCGRTPVQFTNSNTLVGSIYNWDFGDNNNNQSSLQNPSHVYIPTGVSSTTYQIMLAVKDVNSKCFDTVRKTITIGAGPDASITGTNPIDFNGKSYFTICAPDLPNFSFTNQTKTASINSSYKIQWGDGSNDTIMSTWTVVTHNYPVGIFNMKVIVTGSNGCTNTGDYYIFYGSNPALGFANPGNTSICSGDSKTFPVTLTANNPPGTIYEVSYNDGSPSEIYTHPPPTSITHTFNTTSCGVNGTTYQNAFWIKMTASNPCGFTPQPVEPIYVSQKPSTDFGISPKDTTCINTTVTLNNSSTFNNNIKVNPSNGTATCTNGNIVWSITPATGWSVTSGSLGNDNSTTNPANWTSGTNILEINFLISGSYTITLKTGGSTICGSSTKIKTICVNPTPTASFTIPKDTLCAGDNLNFTSTSNTPLCGSNLYSWSVVPATTVGCNAAAAPTFVNPTTPSSANPIINFSKPGTYVVSLTTTIQGTGCTSVAFKHTITVKDKPAVTVALSRPTICQGDTVTPIVTATCFATNATYSWIFTNGTPSTSNVKSPGGIAFNTTGNNNISVDVTNSCGTTTQSTSVSVKPSPTLTATATNATICNGQNATLNLNSNQVGIKYTWTSTVTSGAATGNSNQPTAITTTTISNTLTNTGSVDAVVRYTINVVGATGCIGETKTVDITVRPGTTPPNAGLDQNLCNATTATLAGNNPTVGTGTWTKILGGAATITNANLYNTTITGLLPDIYQFVWTIAGSGGGTCPNTPDTMKIINRPTVTTANAGNDIVVCNFSTVNNSVTLQGNAANPNRSFETGTWTVITKPTGSSASFSNINNPTTTFTFNQIGNYTLAWTIANDITCTPTTDTVTIKVYQAAVGGTTSSSATVCKNNNTGTITLTGFTGNIIKWQYKVLGSAVWVDVANTTSSLNYTNLDTTTTYQAIVTTTNTIDCPITAISSQTIITVNPVPVISNLTATSPTQCASNTGSIINCCGICPEAAR
ncbi:MAG: PKD domain-containing protein, partial [Bacteroidetes bacterium]|nr:PKD domain-containing protein [Bacteroidota bacterium]